MKQKIKNLESIIEWEKQSDAARSKTLREEIRTKEAEIKVLEDWVRKIGDDWDSLTNKMESMKNNHDIEFKTEKDRYYNLEKELANQQSKNRELEDWAQKMES